MKINLLLAGTLLSLSLFSQNTVNTADSLSAKTVTDVDGNTYKTVRIGNQVWMTENLRTTKYSDGTAIPNVTDDNQWYSKNSIWCNYNNDSQNDKIYGKLYNWHAVKKGKLCPTSWHVPKASEWEKLVEFLAAKEGTDLKSTSGWNENEDGTSGNGTDDYGWFALPGGYRQNNGDFGRIGINGSWWSLSKKNGEYAWNFGLEASSSSISQYYSDKKFGLSVRCIKD